MSLCVSGQTLSTAMVNAGLTTFSKIEQTNPRELELVSLEYLKRKHVIQTISSQKNLIFRR